MSASLDPDPGLVAASSEPGGAVALSPRAAVTSSAALRRVVAMTVAVGAAAVLGLAAFLTPAAEGLGTHEQLSLPGCGWVTVADLPCPTCGMTTSFAHAADGNLLASARTQPLGFVLALATAMAFLLGIYVVITGSTVHRALGRMLTARFVWAVGAFALMSWGYKVLTYKGWL
jgi:hypothetical protein